MVSICENLYIFICHGRFRIIRREYTVLMCDLEFARSVTDSEYGMALDCVHLPCRYISFYFGTVLLLFRYAQIIVSMAGECCAPIGLRDKLSPWVPNG